MLFFVYILYKDHSDPIIAWSIVNNINTIMSDIAIEFHIDKNIEVP